MQAVKAFSVYPDGGLKAAVHGRALCVAANCPQAARIKEIGVTASGAINISY